MIDLHVQALDGHRRSAPELPPPQGLPMSHDLESDFDVDTEIMDLGADTDTDTAAVTAAAAGPGRDIGWLDVATDRMDLFDLPHGLAAGDPADALGPAPALRCRGYGLAFGERVVLDGLDLTVPARGITVLLGPSGIGKSVLLRALARQGIDEAGCREWGSLACDGRPLSATHGPTLVPPWSRVSTDSAFLQLSEPLRLLHGDLGRLGLRGRVADLLARHGAQDLIGQMDTPASTLAPQDQRRLAILVAAVANPVLLMVDDPTAGLSADAAVQMLALLRRVAEAGPLLVVMHDMVQARALADHVLLLAGRGEVVDLPATEFFAQPAGRWLKPALPAWLAATAVPAASDPRWHWVTPGRLLLIPMPQPLDGEAGGAGLDPCLTALAAAGIGLLVLLAPEDLPAERLAAHGLRSLHLPIGTADGPSVAQLRMLAIRLSRLARKGERMALASADGIELGCAVAAAWLVHEGMSPAQALRDAGAFDVLAGEASPRAPALLRRAVAPA